MDRNSTISRHGSYYIEENTSRYGFLVLAVILSLAAHFALWKSVSQYRIDVTADVPDSLKTEPAERIRRPDIPVETQPLEAPLTGDPDGEVGRGIQAIIDDYSAKPDPTIFTPPASRETLTASDPVEIPTPEHRFVDTGWQPRQEIMKIDSRLVRDEVALLPRIEVKDIHRVTAAPDYSPPTDMTKDRPSEKFTAPPVTPLLDSSKTVQAPVSEPEKATVQDAPVEEAQTPEVTIARFGPKPSDISSFKPVDSRLSQKTTIFRPEGSNRCFFKIEVAPRDSSVLPAVPKDILLVQDSSRSLANERLRFCKKALEDAVAMIPKQDRFNVVSFRDKATFCFPGWVSPDQQTVAQAQEFIGLMKSEGETDVFNSMKALLQVPRDSKRPLVVILVTDGKATTGLTETTRIIGEFSKLNDNVSVFAVGTQRSSNKYLLDILTFTNRGTSSVVEDGRWGIPDVIHEIFATCAHPVLGRVVVTADSLSGAELYPLPSANLYADRTLEYYGSCPAGTGEIVLQIKGEGGEAKCDVIFRLDLSKAAKGGEEIREGWARRKMHSLVGAYARRPSDSIFKQMLKLSAEEGIVIPYRSELRP